MLKCLRSTVATSKALGDRDHGRIDDAERVDDAEGKAHVLLDEFRDARDVAPRLQQRGSRCRRVT
jgi:hypothetical protein